MKKKDNTEITTNEEQLKEKRKYTKKVQKTKEDLKEEKDIEEKENLTPLEEAIIGWKNKYGTIYETKTGGETIIWRGITRSEYKDIMSTSYDEESDDPVDSMFKKQEKTVRIAVLYPENIDIIMDRMGGLATVLSDAILAKSGFDIKNTSIL